MEYPENMQTDGSQLIIPIDDIEEQNEARYAKYTFDRAKQFWYKKNTEWSYENEYRIMVYTDDAEPFNVDISNCLKAVVFGDRISKTCKQMVGTFFKNQDIMSYFVEFDKLSNKYSLFDIDFAQHRHSRDFGLPPLFGF